MALASQVDPLTGGGGPAIQADTKIVSVYGTITPSNAPAGYATGGDIWDFTAMSLPAGWVLPGFGLPMYCWIWEQTPAGNSGFSFLWRPGTLLTNQKMQVFQSAAAGNPQSELGAGAYPAAILAAVIKFCAVFSYPV